MTSVPAIAPGIAPLQLSAVGRRRKLVNRSMTVVLTVATLLAVVPLVLILYEVVRRGAGAMSVDFLTEPEPLSFRRSGGGYANGIVGTLYMTGIATAFSMPLGILGAVYLVEERRSRLATLVRFFTDVMTGVPSVFVGLFVYAALIRDTSLGFGTLVGALALSIIMLPIIVRSAEEILKLVSQDLRNAAYGLGARRWQTTTRVVIPTAAAGLVTAVMLAVARAAGETAPLILTALGAREIVTDLQGSPQAALPLSILSGARNPFEAGQERAWAGALTLIAIVLVFTLIARAFAARDLTRRR